MGRFRISFSTTCISARVRRHFLPSPSTSTTFWFARIIIIVVVVIVAIGQCWSGGSGLHLELEG